LRLALLVGRSVVSARRAENAAVYTNSNCGARFQRSQSQNDLDRQPFDDRVELRSSASGFNIQRSDVQHDSDKMLRRHPSDVGERYRRSFSEVDGAWTLPAALDVNDVSRADPKELGQPKPRSPIDPTRNLETTWHGDLEHRGDYVDQRHHSEGGGFRNGRENVANVSAAASKRPSVRNDAPKNQDIINWLKHGDGISPQPLHSDYTPSGRDFDRTAANFSSADTPANKLGSHDGYGRPVQSSRSPSQSYHAVGNDDNFVAGGHLGLRHSQMSGPVAGKEDAVFRQFGVSNPAYDARLRTSGSDQTRSSDGSARGKDAVVTQQRHNPSKAPCPHVFANDLYISGAERPLEQSSHGRTSSNDHTPPGPASSVDQRDRLSQIPPPKPVHTIFPDTRPTGGFDQSADLPPSLPPKLTNQKAPPKPAHVSPTQAGPYLLPSEALLKSDHQYRVINARDPVESAPEYAMVQKRPAQTVALDNASFYNVVKEERPGADGDGLPANITSQSRQSPDGTLDSAYISSGRGKPPAQLLQSGASSQEDLASATPARPPLPVLHALAASGVLEDVSRSEPQGGAIDPQVKCFSWQIFC